MSTPGQSHLKQFSSLRAMATGICAILLSTGPVCMAYLDTSVPLPGIINWLTLPLSLLTLSGILLTRYVYIPRFLVNDRLPTFLSLLILTAFGINVMAVGVEYAFRHLFDLSLQSFFNPFSAWTYVYSLISCFLLAFLLAGFSLWTLFENFQRQEKEERKLRDAIKEKSRLFRLGIDMKKVKGMLNEAIVLLEEKEEGDATGIIRKLSEYLRRHLYTDGNISNPTPLCATSLPLSSRTVEFITQKRYRIGRHLCLLLSFVVLACGMFFDRADQPVFNEYNFISASILFAVLTLLGYFNIYVIVPRFLRKGRQKAYLLRVVITICVIYLLLIAQGYLGTGLINPAGLRMPWYVVPLAMGGSMLTFLFLFTGTASLLLIKKNLSGKWKISRMETELSRLELESLQAQVNPHFLFNVLNNACILSYDNPKAAKTTLNGVKEFLDYMIEETERSVTTIGREADFLSNYLAMEKSSGYPLFYSVSCPEELRSEHIPVLLLIPLVENAAKHSVIVRGERIIRIRFKISGERLEFVCSNTYSEESKQQSCPKFPISRNSSGLGLSNTRHRLEILYGSQFTLDTSIADNIFTARLLIPLNFNLPFPSENQSHENKSHEMYNSR